MKRSPEEHRRWKRKKARADRIAAREAAWISNYERVQAAALADPEYRLSAVPRRRPNKET